MANFDDFLRPLLEASMCGSMADIPSVRLSDNFATKVVVKDQSYRYGFVVWFFWKTVYVTHFNSRVHTEWANCPLSRRSVQ